jgi:type II secretory pathway pseudopilin PulG
MSKIFNKSGETLLEVLIALTIVTVAAAAAGSAIMAAVQGLSLSKNYLIAQNLADEGLEAVKNIRDTNWMKYTINKSTCWLVIGDTTNLEGKDCKTAKSFEYTPSLPGESTRNDYKLSFSNGRWNATVQTSDIDTDINLYKLGLKDGKYQNDESGAPVFYRAIRVSDPIDAGEGNIDSITIESIVKWYEGSKLFWISGKEILTNYLQ